MYRIIKIDGTELGITDSVNYIRYGDGGCFTTATRKDAIGVAFKSVAYNLVGHEDIEGADTVVVSEIDGGQELKKPSDYHRRSDSDNFGGLRDEG